MDTPSIYVSMLAGGIAGGIETAITYPTEFVKTRRQLPSNQTCSHVSSPSPSSLHIVRSTYRTSGVRGFYAGCCALVINNAYKSGIRFVSFEYAKNTLLTPLVGERGGRATPVVNVLAGLFAGMVESLAAVTPGEAAKTRIIHDALKPGGQQQFARMGLWKVATQIVRQDGLLALWRGLGPVLCKQSTNSAVRFGTFGVLQDLGSRYWPDKSGNIESTLAPGAVSGVATVYASMPFDNMKTRMQSIGNVYSSMWDCGSKMLVSNGISSFWKGTSPRLLRLTLSSGIAFTVYDQVVRTIRFWESGEREAREMAI